jgi:hypothetical protein
LRAGLRRNGGASADAEIDQEAAGKEEDQQQMIAKPAR